MLATIKKKFSVGKTFRDFELIFRTTYKDYRRRSQMMMTQMLLTFKIIFSFKDVVVSVLANFVGTASSSIFFNLLLANIL